MLVEQKIFSADLSFAALHRVLSNYYALLYLQDHQASFFACLPKAIQRLDQQKIWLRQPDCSYQCHSQSRALQPDFSAVRPQNSQQGLSFQGGYVAFIGYDYAAAQHIQLDQAALGPSAIVAEYDLILKQQHGCWCLYTTEEMATQPLVVQLMTEIEQASVQPPTGFAEFRLQHAMQPRWSKQQYLDAFAQVQQYLHAGDCYQINLTQEFSSQIQAGQLASLLPALLALSQAPFAAYLAFEEFELLSCSPELFIQFNPDGQLITRPIKGTTARHPKPDLDHAAKQQLIDSSKDQAENLMIVDLLRNDLSLYAQTGSVQVPSLFSIESFAQVHHMVSEIRAQLKTDVDPWHVLLSALPGGSITGAPKIRAMQIIQQIEGANRGAYCGSIGYFNYDGSGRFNILIRSLQRYQQQLSVWAGGGITVASEAEAEYQECLDKVSALLAFLDQYQ